MFKGNYHGKDVHPPDLKAVLGRAKLHGIDRIMITAGSLSEVKEATELVKELENEFPGMLSTTVGVHPTRVNEFENGPDSYLQELRDFVSKRSELKIKAIGEFGLDYDRVQFSSPEMQRKYFEEQFILAEDTGLPLFLHMRDAAKDFTEIVKRKRHTFKDGVVHSFTGTAEEARDLLDLDLFIGVNGCSLKTKENLETVKTIPLNRIMVESDAPWCEIRPSHAGFAHIQTKIKALSKEKHDPNLPVKSRNEVFACRQVLEVLASLHQQPIESVADIIYQNTVDIFG